MDSYLLECNNNRCITLYVYFRRSEPSPYSWKPGDVIPTESEPNIYAPESPIPERECAPPQPKMIDLLKSFQQNITENLSRINGKLEAIDEKIKNIEERQKYFEEASSSTSTGTPVSSPLPHGKRRRKTPTASQVYII